MAKKHITVNAGNSGQDFVSVHIEVPDTCEQASAAVQAGISEAWLITGVVMSKMAEIASDCCCNSTVTSATEKSIDDITCSVRVRGRIKGVDPIQVAEAFDEIASMVSQKTLKQTSHIDERNLVATLIGATMAGDLFKPSKMTVEDLLGFGASMGPIGGFEDFANAGAGGLNGFGGFGSNS